MCQYTIQFSGNLRCRVRRDVQQLSLDGIAQDYPDKLQAGDHNGMVYRLVVSDAMGVLLLQYENTPPRKSWRGNKAKAWEKHLRFCGPKTWTFAVVPHPDCFAAAPTVEENGLATSPQRGLPLAMQDMQIEEPWLAATAGHCRNRSNCLCWSSDAACKHAA